MNRLPPILAQSVLRSLTFHSTALFVVLLILMVGAVFVWAAFFRKPRHHHHFRRHHWRASRADAGQTNGTGAPMGSRRRRRRRAHRPTNPTLSQTHGLPPVRDDSSAPPSY
jgi:hypothetical protein